MKIENFYLMEKELSNETIFLAIKTQIKIHN